MVLIQTPFFGHIVALATILVVTLSSSPTLVLGECPDLGDRVAILDKVDGTFNGQQYILVNNPRLTWSEAASTCASYCGVLTSIQSPEEMQFLVSMMHDSRDNHAYNYSSLALVGGYQIGLGSTEFRWIETGLPVDPFIWAPGNPYNSSWDGIRYTTLSDEDRATEGVIFGTVPQTFICKILLTPEPPPNGNETEFSCAERECGSYPDERNCSLYYECTNGTVEHKQCAHGLLFDQVTRSCDLATYAVCAQQFTCEGKACGHYPDPNNCTAFFVCEGNSTRMDLDRRSCPHGLEFDAISKICDLPEFASCSGSNSTVPSTTEWPMTETNFPETAEPLRDTTSNYETPDWPAEDTTNYDISTGISEITDFPFPTDSSTTGTWSESTSGYPTNGSWSEWTSENPGNGSSWEFPSNGSSWEFPGNGSSWEFPGNGSSWEFPGNGSSWEFPGNGSSWEFPGNGSSWEFPGNGSSWEFPGNGSSWEFPGNGSSWEFPGNGSSWEFPGNGSSWEFPGNGSSWEFPGNGSSWEFPGNGSSWEFPGNGSSWEFPGNGSSWEFPGNGSSWEFPGNGSSWEFPGNGSSWEFPGNGSSWEFPGNGSSWEFPGNGSSWEFPGNGSSWEFPGNGSSWEFPGNGSSWEFPGNGSSWEFPGNDYPSQNPFNGSWWGNMINSTGKILETALSGIFHQ